MSSFNSSQGISMVLQHAVMSYHCTSRDVSRLNNNKHCTQWRLWLRCSCWHPHRCWIRCLALTGKQRIYLNFYYTIIYLQSYIHLSSNLAWFGMDSILDLTLWAEPVKRQRQVCSNLVMLTTLKDHGKWFDIKDLELEVRRITVTERSHDRISILCSMYYVCHTVCVWMEISIIS